MNVTLIPANEEHSQYILQMTRDGFAYVNPTLHKVIWRLNKNNTQYYLAKMKDKVVGFVDIEFETELAKLVAVYVQPNYRKKGVGTKITKDALQKIRAAGYTRTILLVREDNLPALRIYRKLGFKPSELPPQEIEGKRAIYMERYDAV